ncbi:MAG: phosphatidylserine decarboxylase family protein [Myxococcales bacterium]|nr:phosphatidylserine decarboxylase family protein [Myxococcales bacterium]
MEANRKPLGRNDFMPVAVEGFPFIGGAAFLCLFFALIGWGFFSFVFLVATGFALNFFRNPERLAPEDPNAIVSPADGLIVEIEQEKDEAFMRGECVRIGIYMNALNVHVNRMPFTGRAARRKYFPGKFVLAKQNKASELNERNSLYVETERGRFIVTQIAGAVARRIACYARPGDVYETGERFGLIRFGSKVDLTLPAGVDIRVRIGEKTRAGETIIAAWGEKEG